MKLKEEFDIVNLVEHLDEIIDHEGDESPVVSIINGLALISSRDKIESQNGQDAVFFGVKKYITMIETYRNELIEGMKKNKNKFD